MHKKLYPRSQGKLTVLPDTRAGFNGAASRQRRAVKGGQVKDKKVGKSSRDEGLFLYHQLLDLPLNVAAL